MSTTAASGWTDEAGPRSVWWHGWRHRTVTAAEARDLAEWREPANPPAAAFNAIDLSPELVATRLRGFVELHPELSERARLDLCRLLPFHPEQLPGAAEAELAAVGVGPDGDAGPIAPQVLDVRDGLPGGGHAELSMGGVASPMVGRPVESRHARVGGVAPSGEAPA